MDGYRTGGTDLPANLPASCLPLYVTECKVRCWSRAYSRAHVEAGKAQQPSKSRAGQVKQNGDRCWLVRMGMRDSRRGRQIARGTLSTPLLGRPNRRNAVLRGARRDHIAYLN